MNFSLKTQTARSLFAVGALLTVAAAHAAGGFVVSPNQEAMVKVGMSTTEVQQALGRPAHNVKFGNEPGPTWSYQVSGAPLVGISEDVALFDVDFGADGKVASIGERTVHIGSGDQMSSN